ncbi:vacuolar protein sorting protein 18 [Cladochytrium replicatum]|nr:vacuolar protein sorting protein 18 [Cladochytrium replicatum]
MSLFDQFEDGGGSMQRYGGASSAFVASTTKSPQLLLEPGYVSTGVLIEGKAPMFRLDQVQFQFPGVVTNIVVSTNVLVVSLEGPPGSAKDGSRQQRMLRIDVGQANAVEEIDIQLAKKNDKIRKLFLDPTARHLLIATELGDTYYLHERWKKPRQLSKFRGVLTEAVAWGRPANSELSTGVILVASRQGHIFEAELQPADEFFKREEKFFRQVYTLAEDGKPIIGIRYEQFPASPRKYVVVLATTDRLYQFVGMGGDPSSEGGMFGTLFRNYDTNPGHQEIPGDLQSSELHFWSQYLENGYPSIPKRFAWLTAPGIYHGTLVFGNQTTGDSIIDNAQLLPYPGSHEQPSGIGIDVASALETPIAVAITEFHFIMLYERRMKAINLLSSDVVYDDVLSLEHGERVQGLAYDPVQGTYWVYTNFSLFELIITEEDRDMWQLYLDRKSFDAAMSYAKNDAQKDKIVTTQAEYYFSQGRFILSATYYAQSLSLSFEDIVLKFISKNEREALKQFLLKKLEKFKKQDVIQTTLAATWLVEIYIQRLITLADEVDAAAAAYATAKVAANGDPTQNEDLLEKAAKRRRLDEEQELAHDEFRQFLKTYKDRVDRATTYHLITSHGRTEDELYFAECVGDLERVVEHHVRNEKWLQALDVISKQNKLELYYRFSPALMENTPQETVNTWIKEPNLDPRKLIPALLKYELSSHSATATLEQNQAIRYLQYVAQKLKNEDPAIHNYLLYLYANKSTPESEDALLMFLSNELENPYFDLQYAIRLALQRGLVQCVVQLYSAMGMYEHAVNTALEHQDLELARINADKPEDDDALRKKLWLRIARHVVEEKKDIKKAMEFLKLSELLKIEDVLPFFPDFVLINDFKEEISAALEEYTNHIEDLRSEMDEATKSAESIRSDIRGLRNKFASISVTERCNICRLPLLTRQFFAFPCEHVFHADCLINQVVKESPPRHAKRILDLQAAISREIAAQRSQTTGGQAAGTGAAGIVSAVVRTHTLKGSDSSVTLTNGKPKHEVMKEELDELVASECVLCGDIIIKSVEKPFILQDEFETVQSWVL